MSVSFMLKTKEGSHMTRSFFILCGFLLSISCSYHEMIEKEEVKEVKDKLSVKLAAPVKEAQSESETLALPKEALSWNADLYLVNFNSEQEEKVRKAVELIKKVIGSQAFRERVLNYEYRGKKEFIDNHGFSNEEVYQKILDGAEKMGNTTKNNTMDVELELYHQATKTIGYTYPNTVRIWMNKKYFSRYTPIKVADNLMHEWMHKLGFTHDVVWSKDRDHSVPYAIGYIVEELAAEIP